MAVFHLSSTAAHGLYRISLPEILGSKHELCCRRCPQPSASRAMPWTWSNTQLRDTNTTHAGGLAHLIQVFEQMRASRRHCDSIASPPLCWDRINSTIVG